MYLSLYVAGVHTPSLMCTHITTARQQQVLHYTTQVTALLQPVADRCCNTPLGTNHIICIRKQWAPAVLHIKSTSLSQQPWTLTGKAVKGRLTKYPRNEGSKQLGKTQSTRKEGAKQLGETQSTPQGRLQTAWQDTKYPRSPSVLGSSALQHSGAPLARRPQIRPIMLLSNNTEHCG